MGGKRVEPTGKYELRDHPSVKGLINVFWHPNGRTHPDSRPLLTLGAPAVPLLAEALAEWELAHHEPPEQSGGLRVVGGSL
jgi:hypothetical protein